MIHLDANLIIGIADATDPHHATASWVISRHGPFAASSVAWMEFASQPMPELLLKATRNLLSNILPFDEPAARLAGELFFLTATKRRHRLDIMIAASTILAGAELATVNPQDFHPFVPHGLKLLALP